MQLRPAGRVGALRLGQPRVTSLRSSVAVLTHGTPARPAGLRTCLRIRVDSVPPIAERRADVQSRARQVRARDLREKFGAQWLAPRPMDNRFNPVELVPYRGKGGHEGRCYVMRTQDGALGVDVMRWNLLGGGAAYPITNVRDLERWRPRLEDPAGRALVPLTEFCEFTPAPIDLGDGKPPLKGEMWFDVPDQDIFLVAGVWQEFGDNRYFAMLTCEPNELVAPIHPKAMITILKADDRERWLTGSYDEVVALQQPYPAALMRVRGPVFPTREKASSI